MFLKAENILSGQEGRAYLTVDGKNKELFYLKSLEATVTKKKTPVRTIGRTGEQYKSAGWSGNGKMVVYYVTSLFRSQILSYIKTGKDSYFDIAVINEGENASSGVQTVVLKNCNLNRVTAARLDVDADHLDEPIEFTFDDIELLTAFSEED